MRMPEIIKSTELTQITAVTKRLSNSRWVPARPLPRNCVLPWYQRFVVSYKVFIGEYDAFKWVEEEDIHQCD